MPAAAGLDEESGVLPPNEALLECFRAGGSGGVGSGGDETVPCAGGGDIAVVAIVAEVVVVAALKLLSRE